MTLPTAPALQIAEPANDLITLRAESPADEAADAAASAARAAALQAVPFSWKGKQLAPYTPSREAAFHQHRAGINAPPFGDCVADSNTFAADAARLLWYLSHPPSEWLNFLSTQPRGHVVAASRESAGGWEPLNAHAALEERIQKWMDDTWTGTKEERIEAYTLCIDIVTRSNATRAVHQDPADPEEGGN